MGQEPEMGPAEPKAAAPGHFHKLVPRQPGTAVERGLVERAFSTPAWPVLADPAQMLHSVLVGPAVPPCTLHKSLREIDAQHQTQNANRSIHNHADMEIVARRDFDRPQCPNNLSVLPD